MDGQGNESPPTRTTILGSFLRGRPRNSSQSHIQLNTDLINAAHRDLSPSSAHPRQPPSPNAISARRRTIAPYSGAFAGQSNSNSMSGNNNNSTSSGLNITSMLRRRRSAGNVTQQTAAAAAGPTPPAISTSATAAAALGGGLSNRSGQPPNASAANAHAPTAPGAPPLPQASSNPSSNSNSNSSASPVHRIRLVPHLDSRRSLRFDAIGRDLKEGDPALRIGRFTDRSGLGLAAVNAMGSNKLAFRSKVVSRAHAEIWVESGGRFFVKDTKSSSGTFLNHVRLSPANTESRPFQIKDGDILQLGVDYQGGAEDIYKSVKIRIEIGREWQAGANAFNTNALKNLKSLALPGTTPSGKQAVTTVKLPASGKSQIPDCCICLFSVTIRQALFIAPCSHTFHYKCIRPLLESHHPAFSCPLCRTYADLEEDVEVEIEYEQDDAEDGDADDADAPDADGDAGGSGKETPEMLDVEVDSPPHSDAGHGHPNHRRSSAFPGSRSNSGLGVRGAEAGAETEVEADGGLGIASLRTRGARHHGPGPSGGSGSGIDRTNSPLPDLPPDEAGDADDEMVIDISSPPAGEMGAVVLGPDGEVVDGGRHDLDATVGGKRKR